MLQLSHVAAGYNGVDVINDISFGASRGENLCLIGPNGCGKTTLLKAVGGLIDYSGSILLGNKEIKNYKRNELAKKISFLSQITTVYFSYTVFEAIMLGRYTQMKGGFLQSYSKEDVEVVNQCLIHVGLEDLRERQINALSGGQLQRVFLARTMAQNPDIILLDEPTNHLDLKHQIELVEYLRNWTKKENKTTIGVFHDVNLAMRLGDRFIVLKDGRVVVSGDVTCLKPEVLKETFGLDVKDYMVETLKIWSDL